MSMFDNPLIKTAAIKMAKKMFADNGTKMICLQPDETGELKITEYKEPVAIVTVAKLEELLKQINELNALVLEYSLKLKSNG